MVPVWLQIVSVIAGIVGTILGIFGISAYTSERMKHKAARRNQEDDEIERLKEQKRLDDLRAVIREENKQINDRLVNIESNLLLNTKGTVTILRNDMKKSLDFCKQKGSVSSSDVANWNELYNVYGELGGNHFREFVDVWKRELNDIPTEIELEAKKEAEKARKPRKKVLVEDK